MDKLLDKVYGALVGAAVGDAMGGPVEMYPYEKTAALHGWVSSFLPYGEDFPPSIYGTWAQAPGAYTDDSRMSKLFAGAIIENAWPLRKGGLRHAFAKAYHHAQGKLERGFLEEYYYKSIYGEDKLLFGGQPANCAVMGVAPFGVMYPCDPRRAFNEALSVLYTAEGYARYAAPMAAALISAAMTEGVEPLWAVEQMLDAVRAHKASREGEDFSKDGFYEAFCVKNETLVRAAVAVARRCGDDTAKLFLALREAVVQEFFADAAETVAIACCMLVATGGDYRKTIEYCVNFGRDNDSSASVAGAAAGALRGASAVPQPLIDRLEAVNARPSFLTLAQQICGRLREEHQKARTVAARQEALFGDA